MHPGGRSDGATVFLEQMEFAGTSNGLSAIGHGEPGENVFDVELDRVQADHQLIRDLLIAAEQLFLGNPRLETAK